MPHFRFLSSDRVLSLLACLLIAKVTLSVMLGYRDYFPPNFHSDFLTGRAAYFFGSYQWAFYPHLITGPVTLVLGLVLLSESFRQQWPTVHRNLGKLQIALIVLVLVPSGLWMACHAEAGIVAATGFAMLAILTGTFALLGWRSAVKRRFTEHRRWMWRCFLLLSSAVVLRLIGGLATVSGIGADATYSLAAWLSWLVPLCAFEGYEVFRRRDGDSGELAHADSQSHASSTSLSLPEMEISARR